eukprot:Pompholyxophrys_punicea_v1_NODE_290_length_2356_cov_40.811280.p2 type:complete len:241 gc:universal NODE_290_length_2356_cov_40.811280:685-1407(+)
MKMVEFHVDLLSESMYEEVRPKLGLAGGLRSVRFDTAVHQNIASSCRFNHDDKVCKCDLEVYHIGQDESIFKAYLESSREWVIQGVRGLHKKSGGPGIMVSSFQDELRGFGFPMTDEEMKTWNSDRRERGLPERTTSPGTEFLSYGKEKQGFWDYDMFAAQCELPVDAFDHLYPNTQLAVEVDHSSGHGKFKPDGLHTGHVNVNFGGKQKHLRDTIIVEGCLGENSANVTWVDQGQLTSA